MLSSNSIVLQKQLFERNKCHKIILTITGKADQKTTPPCQPLLWKLEELNSLEIVWSDPGSLYTSYTLVQAKQSVAAGSGQCHRVVKQTEIRR